jgi:hypothetical protein
MQTDLIQLQGESSALVSDNLRLNTSIVPAYDGGQFVLFLRKFVRVYGKRADAQLTTGCPFRDRVRSTS